MARTTRMQPREERWSKEEYFCFTFTVKPWTTGGVPADSVAWGRRRYAGATLHYALRKDSQMQRMQR